MKRYVLYGIAGLLIIACLIFARYLYWIYSPNVHTQTPEVFLYIRTGATFKDVTDSLEKHGWLKNSTSFKWVAGKKKYIQRVKAGKYLVTNGMTNTQLINRLRAGEQTPVQLIFNNIRTKQQLAGRIGKQLETDSTALLRLLNDADYVKKLGFTTDNIMCLFIPNTYEMFWNTSAQKVMDRMAAEYRKFWNDERRQKLSATGLNPVEAGILASIIEMESNRDDEKPKIAGVYLNRLQKGIKLEADPTLIFAIGDFTRQRLLNRDLQMDSPYNTYKYAGLPPGPITLPSVASIMAVISPVRHDYLFFCAKSDLSGYHLFSRTLAQHMVYAREYQAALNKLDIKR